MFRFGRRLTVRKDPHEGKEMSLTFAEKCRLTWRNGIRYLPLLKNLISRELKKKYRQSVLGYVWCVLNPLLVMLIMSAVFSRVFRNSIDNFPVYLFAGRMMFSFVTDCSGAMLQSIVRNGQLMRKTRIPYYVFPLSSFGCSVINFLFHLIAFLIVLVFTGTWPGIHTAAFPLVCLEMFLFSFGFGLLLAVAEIYARDTNYIFAVLTTAWLYLTPLFYPISVLPELLQKLISWFNPAYYYVHMARSIFLDHMWPDPMMLLRGGTAGLLFTVLGLLLYSKVKKQMILYV